MNALFLLPAILFPAQAPVQEKALTYTSAARPLGEVVENLAKLSGLKLKVESGLENEPLILRLKAVPTKEAMDRIADVCAADWVDHQEFVRLERSDKKVEKRRQEWLGRRTLAIKQSIEQLAKLSQQNPPLTGKGAEDLVKDFVGIYKSDQRDREAFERLLFSANSRLPTNRLLMRILSIMDPAEIARLPLGSRTVFSSEPTPMQRQLPEPPASAMDSFLEDRKALSQAILKTVPDPRYREKSTLFRAASLLREPALILIAFKPNGMSKGVGVEMNVVDAKGRYVSHDSAMLGDFYEEALGRKGHFNTLFVEASKKGFELGPIGRELALRMVPGDPTHMKPLSEPALDAILNPVSRDPLSIATADILFQGADRANVPNVIALVPDVIEAWAKQSSRYGKTSLEIFLEGAGVDGQVLVEQSDDWLSLLPSRPEVVASERMPRDVLQSFLQHAYQMQKVSIEDAAGLAIRAPEAELNDVARVLRLFLPSYAMDVAYTPSPILQLYGWLSPEQRQAAKTGGVTVPLATLPEEGRNAALRTFYEGTYVQFGEIGKPTVESEDANLLLDERTWAVPNGLGGTDAIFVKDDDEPAAFLTYSLSGGSSYQGAVPFEELTDVLAAVQRPDLFPPLPPQIQGARLGKQRRLHMHIRSQTGFEAFTELGENFPGEGEIVALDRFLDILSPEQRLDMERRISTTLEARAQIAKAPQAAPASTKPPR